MLKSSQFIKILSAYSGNALLTKNFTSKLLQSKFKSKSFVYPCYNSSRFVSTSFTLMEKDRITITFVTADGTHLTGTAEEGESLLDVVVNNEIDLTGYGVCEGALACSTCWVTFKEEDFQKLEEAQEEELDMLCAVPDACDTSRLGCQVRVTEDMSGLTVKLPGFVKFIPKTEEKSGK